MAKIPETFEEACAAIGVPSDRIGLVKRNLHLKMKCKQRGEFMLQIQQQCHKLLIDFHPNATTHSEPFETCQASCKHVRELLELTDPEKDKP